METFVNAQERAVVQACYDTVGGIQELSAVQGITRSGTTATVTKPAHGYENGESITHAGAEQTAYNIAAAITVIDADHYSYTVSGSPVTPATGSISASSANQSVVLNLPSAIQVETIAAATTVKVEACIRRSLGWRQIGADLTISDNGAVVPLTGRYNFVRLRRSAGSGAVKAYGQQ